MIDRTWEALYARAEPYLQTRDNDTHTRIAFGFAVELLRSHPQADPAIVLPAIILHDVGWSAIAPEEQLRAFGPHMRDTDLRRVHEREGARIAAAILSDLGYDTERIAKIVEIIDGHDSRTNALSLDDALVKDADKLWRYSEAGMRIDGQRFGMKPPELSNWLKTHVDEWFFTEEAKRTARALLSRCDRSDRCP